LARVSDRNPRLDEIIPDGIFVGTSLILPRGGRFLYGMRPLKGEGGRPVIELTGIGGGVEAFDESYSAGALREACEEIGCDVRLIPCPETLIVRSRDRIERVRLGGRERPAAVVYRKHRTPPHRPWHERNAGEVNMSLGTPPGTKMVSVSLPPEPRSQV
jgi:hypothetical protein